MQSKKIQVLDSSIDVYSVIEKITEIPDKDDSFYVFDVSKVIWLYENWKTLMPRVQVFYAVKCNDYKLLLETYAALGTGFDCATKEEIRKIIALGVDPKRIIFANPTKLISHIEYAVEVGVNVMTFDNESELYKMKKHCPTAELVIRIRCDDTSAVYKLGKKFGVLPEGAFDLLKLAKTLDLNVIGVAFHVGSGARKYSTYYDAIAAARKVFDMGTELGYNFTLLDIGGGYPGAASKPINEIADFVNKGLEEYFPDTAIKVIAEPGNYACNEAFKLVTQIHSKNIVTVAGRPIRMYYVDVSAYNCLFGSFFGEFYKCRPVHKVDEEKVYPSVLWGSTMEQNDKLSEIDHYLPDLKIGSWIIFEEVGGYTLTLSCGFSGFSIPDIFAVINKDDWLMLTEKYPKTFTDDRFRTDSTMETFHEDIRLQPYTFTEKYF